MDMQNLQFNELIMEMHEILSPHRESAYPARDAMLDIAILWRDSEGCTTPISKIWAIRDGGTILKDRGTFKYMHPDIKPYLKKVYEIQWTPATNWAIYEITF